MGASVSKKVHVAEMEKKDSEIKALQKQNTATEAKLNKDIAAKKKNISELNENVARFRAKLRLADKDVQKTGIRHKEAENFDQKVAAVFNAYDDDHDGYLSFEEIADIYRDKAMEVEADFFPRVLATVSPGFNKMMLTKWYAKQEANLNEDYETVFPQESFVARLLALMGKFDGDSDCCLGQEEMTALIQVTRPISLTSTLKMSALKKASSSRTETPTKPVAESKTETPAKDPEGEAKAETPKKDPEGEAKAEAAAAAPGAESKVEAAPATPVKSDSDSRWEKLCKMCNADPAIGFDFTALSRRYTKLKKTLSLDLEEDYKTVFFSEYNSACSVVSGREKELADVSGDLDKKKKKLTEQQKQQKDAMKDTTSPTAKAAAIFGMFRESEEDGDAFLNFKEYSELVLGVAGSKNDGASDNTVLTKQAWEQLTKSIPECDPDVGISLDAFISLNTIQQNTDLNKSYDEFFFAKYNELNSVYKAKEAAAKETAAVAATKTKACEDWGQTLTTQKESKQIDQLDQMATALFGKFHDFKDLTDYRLSQSQLQTLMEACTGEKQEIGNHKWALYCSEVKVEEVQVPDAAEGAPKQYKGMTLAQFVAWANSPAGTGAGLDQRKAIRKIFYVAADAALKDAGDKNNIATPLIAEAKTARTDADAKRAEREEQAKLLQTVSAEADKQEKTLKELKGLLSSHASTSGAGTEPLAHKLVECVSSTKDIRGEQLQQLFDCPNNSAAVKRVEELAALRGLGRDHFVQAHAKGLLGSGNVSLDYYTMFGASTPAQQMEAIFVLMDKDKDGKLSASELGTLLKETVGGDADASAQEILTTSNSPGGVDLQQLEKLYASAATDDSARTWLRSVAADYAKMPYAPKFTANGAHVGGGKPMSEAIFAACDKDSDGYLQGVELLAFFQACQKGSPNAESATRRIGEMHTAVGPGVTGLDISLLKHIFADPKRFNLPARYHATTFDKFAVAPAQKALEGLQQKVAAAKEALTKAEDLHNPAESDAQRKEGARDEAVAIFEKADAEAKTQVGLADAQVQEHIVRIYGALAEKARQEKQAAQAKADTHRADADSANAVAETERKAGEATAASCKNKAWDASVNWLDMRIKEIEERKRNLEATLKSDQKTKEKQLDMAKAESLRCRRVAEKHMVIALKKEYTEKKRAADEAATTQRVTTDETLADVEKQIKLQLERRAKAEQDLVEANANAKASHLMSVHAELIPRVNLLHEQFDADKDGHLMDSEFLIFAKAIGRDIGKKNSKSPKKKKSGRKSNKVAPAPEMSDDATLRKVYERSMMECSNGLTLEMMTKLYRDGVMKHDVDTDYKHLFANE